MLPGLTSMSQRNITPARAISHGSPQPRGKGEWDLFDHFDCFAYGNVFKNQLLQRIGKKNFSQTIIWTRNELTILELLQLSTCSLFIYLFILAAVFKYRLVFLVLCLNHTWQTLRNVLWHSNFNFSVIGLR